jgi:hypothetical protein
MSELQRIASLGDNTNDAQSLVYRPRDRRSDLSMFIEWVERDAK